MAGIGASCEKRRHAVIYLNGKPSYQEVYKENFGKIVSLFYIICWTETGRLTTRNLWMEMGKSPSMKISRG